MSLLGEIMLQFSSINLPFGVVSAERSLNPSNEVAIVFSSPQFFMALIAGVLMAFAFQLVLTNLSIAAKISADDSLEIVDDDQVSENWGKAVRNIEAKIGLWTIVTVNIALSIACFLAVKLTLISSVVVGAILGVVIWSAFFLLLFWMGSTALGSMIGSVFNTANSGLQGVIGTASAAFSGNAMKNQIVSAAEASATAIRRELTSGFEPSKVRDQVQDYITQLQLPSVDVSKIRGEFENIFSGLDLSSLADSNVLGNINRQTFVDLVSSRSDFSRRDSERIVDQLETAWNQVIKRQPLLATAQNYLGSMQPQEPSSSFGKQLDETAIGSREKQPGLMERVVEAGAGALVGSVAQKVDLSNLDAQQVSGQLQQLKDQAQKFGSQVVENLPMSSANAIKGDVENYLLNSQPWHLNRETIKQEFKDVIYDPEAAPAGIVRQLAQINPDFFVEVLKRRGDFDEEQINEIREQLVGIFNEVSETVKSAASQEQSQDLQSRVEEYLRSTGKEELNPDAIARDFQALLEDPQAGFEALSDRFSQFDRDTLLQLISQREDFSPEEADQLVNSLAEVRDRVLSQAQETQAQAQSRIQELRQRVEEYLHNTNLAELDPEGIKRDFQTLFADPQAGFNALRERLSQFDRETLVQLLNQRQGINEEQVNQIVDQIESVRDRILHAPDQAKEQYERIVHQISDYLKNTNLDELNPEGIKEDLNKLLHDPKSGALALRDRLSHVDRETLVQLLSQREDLSEEQVNQTIDQVQDAINQIVKAPRRLASRAQHAVQDWQSSLADYLRNTNKEELNPEGIKRDLQLVFNDPKSGLQSVRDRLSQFNRDTFVSLLSQREDISESEANHIADQIVSVRDQMLEQVHQVQDKFQSAINGVFDRIRNYLNALERPELNYEGIKHDFRKLFDDPEAGFDAIKERLSQFDRDTLVALLSSRSDITEEDANRIISQFEDARNSVLERSERIQMETKKRIKHLKHQAKQQAEQAQKVAANAAWWLFGTAITSVATAALAGAIAVAGFRGLIG